MTDLCKAGLWDIDPKVDCPICGAMPDTECDGGEIAMLALAQEDAVRLYNRTMRVGGGTQT